LKANGKIAVDTNAVIAYRAGISEVCGIINSAEVVLIPAIVVGELRYGALNSRRIEENQEAVDSFLEHSVFIRIDEKISARYAAVRFALKKIGRPLPENDIWIAAACLEMDVPLLTRDSHFENVEGLRIIPFKSVC